MGAPLAAIKGLRGLVLSFFRIYRCVVLAACSAYIVSPASPAKERTGDDRIPPPANCDGFTAVKARAFRWRLRTVDCTPYGRSWNCAASCPVLSAPEAEPGR